MQTSRLASTIAAIDAANSEDPRSETVEGRPAPSELLYSQRMTARLSAMYSEASEVLQIAARSQHIRRWTMPRADYPQGKAGYHAWRRDCRVMHADTAGRIMEANGYDRADIDQVGRLIRKEGLKTDPESQRLQNVVGVVFVEHYLAAFAQEHAEEKVVDILRKTARKLDAEGLRAIADLDLAPELKRLIDQLGA